MYITRPKLKSMLAHIILNSLSSIACLAFMVMKRLQNRSLQPKEAQAARSADDRAALQLEESNARDAAKAALRQWYMHGYNTADACIANLQRESNLQEVAAILGWQEQKGRRNGYVMLTTLLTGTLRPMIIVLDYEDCDTGGVTYRQLHQQIRYNSKLENKVSLRMCPLRLWYEHMQHSCPIPERFALPATDVQCRNLLGTTLLYFPYVHLADKCQHMHRSSERTVGPSRS